MRCTALRRNWRSVVQAFRREPRLPLGQAGRSELQRSDLRQSLRRRGRRGLHAHLVPRPQTQWRLRPADEASHGKPGGAFSSPNRLWRRRAVRLTFSNSDPGRNSNAAFWPHVVGRERPRHRLAQRDRAEGDLNSRKPSPTIACGAISACRRPGSTRSRASSITNATKTPALPSPTPALHYAPSRAPSPPLTAWTPSSTPRTCPSAASRRARLRPSCARVELTGLASELSRE